jgi:hypothetical protein
MTGATGCRPTTRGSLDPHLHREITIAPPRGRTSPADDTEAGQGLTMHRLGGCKMGGCRKAGNGTRHGPTESRDRLARHSKTDVRFTEDEVPWVSIT